MWLINFILFLKAKKSVKITKFYSFSWGVIFWGKKFARQIEKFRHKKKKKKKNRDSFKLFGLAYLLIN
jgi:hypothetical protein